MATSNNRFAALIDSNNTGFTRQKNPRNQKHNKFHKDNRQNRFQMFDKKQKKENKIDLGEKAFPSLVKSVEFTEEEKEANPTKGMSYIEKIKYFKELNEKKDTLPKGWIRLNKKKDFKPFTKINLDKNPYYNPYASFAIIYERYINREELNHIIGDISPYWNMDEEYEYDTRDLEENEDDDESNYSDYSDEDEYYD